MRSRVRSTYQPPFHSTTVTPLTFVRGARLKRSLALRRCFLSRSLHPASGTLDFNSDGSFTYTPATNFEGAVTFTNRFTGSFRDNPVDQERFMAMIRAPQR